MKMLNTIRTIRVTLRQFQVDKMHCVWIEAVDPQWLEFCDTAD